MSPALEKQIADTLGAAQQTGSEALSFIKERAPILAEQIIRYEMTVSLVAHGLLAVLLFIWVSALVILKAKDAYDGFMGTLIIGGMGLVAVMLWVGVDFLPRLLMVMTAPDLVILNYITGALGK